MTWAAAKEAIRLAVAGASGVADYASLGGGTCRGVIWEGQETHWEGPVNAELELSSTYQVGRTETRTQVVDSRLVETVNTLNILVVRVRIKSESQDDAEEAVGSVAGRMRALIRTKAARQLLREAGVKFVDQLTTANADFRNKEGRQESYAITDFRFAYAHAETAPELGDYIASVEATGQLGTINVAVDVGSTPAPSVQDLGLMSEAPVTTQDLGLMSEPVTQTIDLGLFSL